MGTFAPVSAISAGGAIGRSRSNCHGILGIEVEASYGWNFKMIHKTLLREHPTLDKLAVLLEKVLFRKLANCRDLDLKTTRAILLMTEYVVPVVAGIVVSLISKYILNNRALETCCEPETEEAEHANSVSDNSDVSDALSRASALTSSTLTPPHPVHYHHTHR